MQRRDFIKQSVAVAAAGSLVTQASASIRPATLSAPRQRIDAVVVDRRYSDSIAFAAALQQQGARLIDAAEDLGIAWYGELGAAFASAPLRLAGLTPHSDLFICESFAREHGARVVYTGAHDCRGVQMLTHTLDVGSSLSGLGAELDDAGSNWSSRLARQLGRGVRETPARERIATLTRRADDFPGMLFSWLIA